MKSSHQESSYSRPRAAFDSIGIHETVTESTQRRSGIRLSSCSSDHQQERMALIDVIEDVLKLLADCNDYSQGSEGKVVDSQQSKN